MQFLQLYDVITAFSNVAKNVARNTNLKILLPLQEIVLPLLPLMEMPCSLMLFAPGPYLLMRKNDAVLTISASIVVDLAILRKIALSNDLLLTGYRVYLPWETLPSSHSRWSVPGQPISSTICLQLFRYPISPTIWLQLSRHSIPPTIDPQLPIFRRLCNPPTYKSFSHPHFTPPRLWCYCMLHGPKLCPRTRLFPRPTPQTNPCRSY
jgi:hypothetical protein